MKIGKKKITFIIQDTLLKWFQPDIRGMPWRKTRDPYAIWISEIMLQQTRVNAVIPYYQRFMKRFPDVQSLGRARIDTVLKLWEGMGYYSRARNLHQASKMIVNDYQGKLPQTVSELRKLPGIGPYTAGAIASIAFEAREPVLDGNVIRVLCRVHRISANPGQTKTKNQLWRLADKLLPNNNIGDFNQALMELGATVCLPANPLCGECPIAAVCRAKKRNQQNMFPVRAGKKVIPHYTVVAGVVWKNDKILIDKRLPDGLLGGLWEFPGGKRKTGESLKAAVEREIYEELAVRVEAIKPYMKIEHAYSHFRITLHVFECRYLAGRPQLLGCADCKWVLINELRRYAFPAANQKIIRSLLKKSTRMP